jgi:hypothetical protein
VSSDVVAGKRGQALPMVRSVKTGWYLAPICTGFLTAMILPARWLTAAARAKACRRWTAFDYAHYKAQQFDLLADAMRKNIDIDRIYQIMHQHQERAC